MKKYFVLGGVVIACLLFSNCHGPRQTAAAPVVVPKSTYESNMTSVIVANCSPCHIPAKGGNKRSYDNYANVKSDIDNIIRRISMNPGERGFMPMKHPKLSDSTIAIFQKWKDDGMLEK